MGFSGFQMLIPLDSMAEPSKNPENHRLPSCPSVPSKTASGQPELRQSHSQSAKLHLFQCHLKLKRNLQYEYEVSIVKLYLFSGP